MDHCFTVTLRSLTPDAIMHCTLENVYADSASHARMAAPHLMATPSLWVVTDVQLKENQNVVCG